MSQKNPASQSAKGNEPLAEGKEQTKLQVKKVPLKVSPSAVPTVLYQPDARLPEAMVVLIVSDSRVESYTMHHPIGITDLRGEEWVFSKTSEIPTLLARSHDPNQKKVDEARQKARSAYLVAQALLILKDDKLYYPSEVAEGRERNAVLNEADSALKAAKVKEKLEFEQSKPSEEAKKNFSSKLHRDSFLSPQVLSHEQKIRAALTPEILKREVEDKCPQTYRTLGGPLSGQRQSSVIPGLNKDKNGAFDFLVQILHPLSMPGGVVNLYKHLGTYWGLAKKDSSSTEGDAAKA